MSVVFGNVPIVSVFSISQGVAVGGPSVVLPIQVDSSEFIFSLSSPRPVVPHGVNFACGFGVATPFMPGKFGFDFSFGNVPLVTPVGLQI